MKWAKLTVVSTSVFIVSTLAVYSLFKTFLTRNNLATWATLVAYRTALLYTRTNLFHWLCDLDSIITWATAVASGTALALNLISSFFLLLLVNLFLLLLLYSLINLLKICTYSLLLIFILPCLSLCYYLILQIVCGR